MEEATYYYHPDHLGSVSVVSNHKGEPYERVEYLPFGEVWIEDADPATSYIPFRFTSKELDKETGLYYYGARYYEPKYSLWMSADPAGFALINPNRGGYSVIEATNWYAYVSNNPVKYVDPTGEELKVKGSKNFEQKVEKDLNKIRSKPKGKKLVEKLENSKKRHVIRETKKGNSARHRMFYKKGKRGTGSVIRYNPSKQTGGRNTKGSYKRPPFIGLAHEFGHAEAIDEGTQSIPPADRHKKYYGSIPRWETNSMRKENEIRAEHGIPFRPAY